jgi:hydroxymethylpyrimidine pyrophosphatase-like HAD family hydrolase
VSAPNQGWIKLHRTLIDHPRFTDGDWTKLWVFLLSRATHSELKRVFDGVVITVKAGQLITSRDAISKSCDIDRNKVERLLKTLKSEQQIEQLTCSTCRLITIINWDKYQKGEQQNEQRESNERAASEQQVSTHKNGNKGETDDNEKEHSEGDARGNNIGIF